MAISIPVTLAMTFGVLYLISIDIQQVSVATLIIALGLLVDDPVIAGDSIKRALAEGNPPVVAAWLGPTKLATAIMYATVTNIVAYLPFLLVTGSTGEFLFSLPIVMTVALVASRLVSMTFLPLLGITFFARKKILRNRWRSSADMVFSVSMRGQQNTRSNIAGSSFSFAPVSCGRRADLLKAKYFLLSRRCSVLVVHRRLVAERHELWCHKRDCPQS
jgi:multidrug efflux pump subunit AcrB